jgi:hypothetical protein
VTAVGDELLFHLWLIAETTNRELSNVIDKWNAGKLWVPDHGYKTTEA